MARPRGRPSGCTPERIDQARRLARLGLTEAEMAEFWGVAPSTVTSWKTAHPEFLAALKDGEIAADAWVAPIMI